MKHIAALLTVHNRKVKTLECLTRLLNQSLPDGWSMNVFLTDDGCTDGTREAIAEQFPEVRIVDGDGSLFWNRGMIAAWEAAVSHADYDAYLWVNDDTMLDPSALTSMLSAHQANPSAIIVGSTYSKVNHTPTYGGYFNEKLIEPDGVNLQPCHRFNGNVVLVPGTVYKTIGGLDPVYTHAIGDTDYGMTAAEQGIDLLVATHFVGTCERNPSQPKWTLQTTPFRERVKNLFSPLGYSVPREYYHFKRKHWGHISAIVSLISAVTHVISPKLWDRICSKSK